MISTHVLDTSLGSPASGVSVTLEKKSGDHWNLVGQALTNSDGRIVFQVSQESGSYRLLFQVGAYFSKLNTDSFFTEVPVLFEIKDTTRKYHVPLLLNPYGYSTYRGS